MSGADLFDGLFAVMFLYLGVKGFLRGLTGELCSLLGLFGGIFLAWKLGPILGEHFSGSIPPDKLSVAVIIFIAVNLGSSLIYRMIRLVVKFAFLGTLDRLGGILSGLVKGTALLLLVFVAATMIRLPLTQSWFVESRSMRIAAVIWPHISEYMDSHGMDFPGNATNSSQEEPSFTILSPKNPQKETPSSDERSEWN
jgi:membrane protein required for colicin V production